MIYSNLKKLIVFFVVIPLLTTSCKGPDGKFKLPGGDARKTPADPEKRVEQNLKEGRGFKLNDAFNKPRGGVFDFASSNELWRASLDVIDFMPLALSAMWWNHNTDWYSNAENSESIKINQFLTNEIRSDALVIKVFNKQCFNNSLNCKIIETDGAIILELKKILKTRRDIKKKRKKKNNKLEFILKNIKQNNKLT